MLLSFILTPTGLSAAPRFVSSGRLLPHQINFQCEREVWSTPLAGSLFLFVFALCIELTYFLIIMIVSFLYIEDKRKKKCFLRALVNYIKWPWQVNVSDLWILFVILNWPAFCKYVIFFFFLPTYNCKRAHESPDIPNTSICVPSTRRYVHDLALCLQAPCSLYYTNKYWQTLWTCSNLIPIKPRHCQIFILYVCTYSMCA